MTSVEGCCVRQAPASNTIIVTVGLKGQDQATDTVDSEHPAHYVSLLARPIDRGGLVRHGPITNLLVLSREQARVDSSPHDS
jgi:hypothetical protein